MGLETLATEEKPQLLSLWDGINGRKPKLPKQF